MTPLSQCSGGRLFNKASNKCECPASLPCWNGVICLACNDHWSSLTKSCIACQEGQHWDQQAQNCVRCPEGSVYDTVNLKCVEQLPTCQGGQIYNRAT